MTFAADISAWSKRTKQDIDTSVRNLEMQLFTAIIMQSPVGNPELWKRYTRKVNQREAYTTFADAFNAQGDKRRISVSNRALNRKFGRIGPKGYVGGRFRGNWNASIGTADMHTTTTVDPTGVETVARMKGSIGGAGKVTYLANNLPYAARIEFGWSKQAPAGMVRINMTRIAAIGKIGA